MKSLKELKLSKKDIAGIIFVSMRDRLDDILKEKDLHSTRVTMHYSDGYVNMVNTYKSEILKKVLIGLVTLEDFFISIDELNDFLNTVDTEQEACKFLIECIQSYSIGEKENLESLLSEPLNEKEIQNLFIIQTILIDFYKVLSDDKYKEAARNLVLNKFDSIFEEAKIESESIREAFGEVLPIIRKKIIKEIKEV